MLHLQTRYASIAKHLLPGNELQIPDVFSVYFLGNQQLTIMNQRSYLSTTLSTF